MVIWGLDFEFWLGLKLGLELGLQFELRLGLGATIAFFCLNADVQITEVESRTQGSRPRTQKKIRGQGQEQPFRGQTLSRPRTGMLKDQGHKRKCSP